MLILNKRSCVFKSKHNYPGEIPTGDLYPGGAKDLFYLAENTNNQDLEDILQQLN